LAEVSFRDNIVPILKAKCATCHLTGQEGGKMALHPGAAYKSLVGIQSSVDGKLLVKPGEPDQSYLMIKLLGLQAERGGQGARMPFGGAPLDKTLLEQISTWIANGAPDN
jgi:hypothetical protein